MSEKRAKQFRRVARPKVPRNRFDLSHERRFSADMFWLIPVLLDDCIPGDVWKIGNNMVIRMNPLATPVMHEINAFVHYFFVPYRLLWEDWEKFITGGQDGKFTADLPYWEERIGLPGHHPSSLWDYFGFNTGNGMQIAKRPLIFPLRAYNFIWNEYYRDPNIMDEVDLDDQRPSDSPGGQYDGLRLRCFEKDYFTSMLPWQQRGVQPAFDFEVLGETSAVWENFPFAVYGDPSNFGGLRSSGIPDDYVPFFGYNNRSYPPAQNEMHVQNLNRHWNEQLNRNTVKLDDAVKTTSFDISQLRLAFQVQRFLERNARTGARYTEFLKGHFPAYPRDDRLQRPEYIGGSKTPIMISEVLQTSASDHSPNGTPQGNMAGHGISADRTFVGSYRVQEHGLIMGLMSIMPRTMYSQGIDRVWLKESKYDFYFPEFANLSEQAVYTSEIYNYNPMPVDSVIGYQGRYDEYRWKRNTVHGLFRNDFNRWHLGREFDSAPTLNEDLVAPNANERYNFKRCMAAMEEPMFLVSFGNNLDVTRPLPFMATPGLIDHN